MNEWKIQSYNKVLKRSIRPMQTIFALYCKAAIDGNLIACIAQTSIGWGKLQCPICLCLYCNGYNSHIA